MNKFHRFDIDWSQFTWRIVEAEAPENHWDFDTQEEAHAFLESVKKYRQQSNFFDEVVKK